MTRKNSIIVQRVLNNVGTKKQAKDVAGWFATDEGQEWLSQDYDKEARKAFANYPPTCSSAKNKRRRFIRTFASCSFVAVLIFVAFFVGTRINPWETIDSSMKELSTSNGENIVLAFQEGSRIELNGGSTISYPCVFAKDSRTVSFSGEAIFAIAKNPEKPFIIKIEGAQVVVTGTEFNLKAYPEDTRVTLSLIEGTVLFREGEHEYSIHENQVLSFDKSSMAVNITDCENVANAKLWANDGFIFVDQPLSEILNTLSRMSGIRFEICKGVDPELSFSFSSTGCSIDETLNDMERISNIRFVKQGDITYVKIK